MLITLKPTPTLSPGAATGDTVAMASNWTPAPGITPDVSTDYEIPVGGLVSLSNLVIRD